MRAGIDTVFDKHYFIFIRRIEFSHVLVIYGVFDAFCEKAFCQFVVFFGFSERCVLPLVRHLTEYCFSVFRCHVIEIAIYVAHSYYINNGLIRRNFRFFLLVKVFELCL